MIYVSDQEAKEQIIEFGKRAYSRGFVAANDGNVTVRVGENEVWCTPTGVSKGFMTEEMLVKMDLDGNILVEGTKPPTSEIKMHLRVFRENPEVMSVFHAHPQVATAFACAGIPLNTKAYLIESILAIGVVPCVHYADPGTEGVPDSVAPYVRTHNGVLLANHGALTWGRSAEEAFYRMESVEYSAKAMVLNEYILKQYMPLSDDQVNYIVGVRKKHGIETGGRPESVKEAVNLEDHI
ncbi:MAG: class II aldolase/adducin family protein [Lachnospiraceae bacterium]|nr:class II aldolase/adducin family protein [Lachnospiraceae bacterium]